MSTPVAIAAIPSHVAGDVFTAAMWTDLQNDINQGIVEQVGVMVERTTNQSAPASTEIILSFDTDVQDVYGMWASGSPTQLVAATQGWYRCSVFTQWAAVSVSAAIETRFKVNGATVLTAGAMTQIDNSHSTYSLQTASLYLNAGDVVTIGMFQRGSGALACTAATVALVRV